jgi:hypothetical protein
MDFIELGKQLAKIGLPLLGAALPIPGGVAIGTALAGAINSPSSKPEDILATLTQSSEALEKARQFELTHQEVMLKVQVEHETTLARIEADDRASARSMQVANKSYMPATVSVVVIFAALGLEGYVLITGIPEAVSELVAGRILGTLDMAFATVLAFWLGSSSSSRTKDATISKLSN